jgi:hypothetical protein
MAATLIGIICAADTLELRRLMKPDDDAELDAVDVVGAGEVLFKAPLSAETDVRQAIADAAGVPLDSVPL